MRSKRSKERLEAFHTVLLSFNRASAMLRGGPLAGARTDSISKASEVLIVARMTLHLRYHIAETT